MPFVISSASNAVEAGVDFYDSRRLARSSRRWSIAGAGSVFASEGGASTEMARRLFFDAAATPISQ